MITSKRFSCENLIKHLSLYWGKTHRYDFIDILLSLFNNSMILWELRRPTKQLTSC